MHRFPNLTLAGLALAAVLAAPAAQAASFPCNKAQSPREKTVCAVAELSAADEALAAAYQRARERSGAAAALRENQRMWLAGTDETCGDARCFLTRYRERIALLDQVADKSAPAGVWHGHYVRTQPARRDAAELTLLALADGRVLIRGSATWEGPNAAAGQVNTGEINTIGNLKGGSLAFSEDGCSGRLERTGAGIRVMEESGCGGMNVSFVGPYQRR